MAQGAAREAVCRVQQEAVCRALQERVLSAVREHCACAELAGVCGVGWSTVVTWNDVQLELVVSDVR